MTDERFGPFHPPISLTDAEWAVLEELRAGRTAAQAAVRLGVTEKVLRASIRNVAEKLKIVASL